MRSRPQSRSSSLMIRGGASLIAFPVGLLGQHAASREPLVIPRAPAATRTPARPKARGRAPSHTVARGSADSRACIRSPSTLARAWYSQVRSIAMTSRATAQASGLPPERGPMLPRVQHRQHRPRRHHRREPERIAAAESLAEQVSVGHHAFRRAGEREPGAAEAGLDLVRDHQDALRRAQVPDPGQEAGRGAPPLPPRPGSARRARRPRARRARRRPRSAHPGRRKARRGNRACTARSRPVRRGRWRS